MASDVRFQGVTQIELREELQRFQDEMLVALDLRMADGHGLREAMPEPGPNLKKSRTAAMRKSREAMIEPGFGRRSRHHLTASAFELPYELQAGLAGARSTVAKELAEDKPFAFGASALLKRAHTNHADPDGHPKLTRQERKALTLGRGGGHFAEPTRSPDPEPEASDEPNASGRRAGGSGYRTLALGPRETTDMSVASATTGVSATTETPSASQMPLLKEAGASNGNDGGEAWSAHWDSGDEKGRSSTVSPPTTGRSWPPTDEPPRPLLQREGTDDVSNRRTWADGATRDSLDMSVGFDFIKPADLLQGPMAEVVKHPMFDAVVGVMVALSSIQVGFEANWGIQRPGHALAPLDQKVGLFFCAVFLSEQGIRMMAYGSFRNFSHHKVRVWNTFDLSVVMAQVLYHLLEDGLLTLPTGLEKVLRVTAIGRVFRIFRMFHIFHSSEALLNSILQSMWSFSWGIFVCITLMYTFAVLLMECVIQFEDSERDAHLIYWFGGLPRTLLTLLEVVMGGVSWDEVVEPLIEEVSPAVGILFCVYVVFGFIALLNVVSGIFSEGVTRMVREDKDNGKAALIRDHFLDGEMHCDRRRFKRKMKSETMVEYLESLGLHSTDVDAFFDLLDSDDDGFLHSDEIVKGCLELRGPAKALNLTLLARSVDEVLRKLTLLCAILLPEPDLDAESRFSILSEDPSRCSVRSEDELPVSGAQSMMMGRFSMF